MKAQTIGWLVVAVIVVAGLIARKESFTTASIPESSTAGNSLALIAVRNEPKVKEAIITNVNVLYASVLDDGTKRNGYAEYLCMLLKEKGSTANRVKIVKFGSTNDPNRDNAYGVLLGEAWCR